MSSTQWYTVLYYACVLVLGDGTTRTLGLFIDSMIREVESKTNLFYLNSIVDLQRALTYILLPVFISVLPKWRSCSVTSYRLVVLFHGSLIAFGLFALALIRNSYLTLVLYSIPCGVGMSMLFADTILVFVEFFDCQYSRYTLSPFVLGAGTVGSFAIAGVNGYLIDAFGWRVAVSIIATVVSFITVLGPLLTSLPSSSTVVDAFVSVDGIEDDTVTVPLRRLVRKGALYLWFFQCALQEIVICAIIVNLPYYMRLQFGPSPTSLLAIVFFGLGGAVGFTIWSCGVFIVEGYHRYMVLLHASLSWLLLFTWSQVSLACYEQAVFAFFVGLTLHVATAFSLGIVKEIAPVSRRDSFISYGISCGIGMLCAPVVSLNWTSVLTYQNFPHHLAVLCAADILVVGVIICYVNTVSAYGDNDIEDADVFELTSEPEHIQKV